MNNITSLERVTGQRSNNGHEWLCGSQEKASVKCQGKDTVRKNRLETLF